MLTICWAAKGGSGTTVVSCALALLTQRRRTSSLLIDLDGDVPAALGIAEPSGPGAHDWLHSSSPSDAIAAISIAVNDGLRLVARGAGSADPLDPRWGALARFLVAADGSTVVDCGTAAPPPALFEHADQRLLVTRPCYLALRRAGTLGLAPSGVVVVREPGRALRADDISAAVGVPVVAEVNVDPAVARAVDAGLLAARLPRSLLSSLAGVAA